MFINENINLLKYDTIEYFEQLCKPNNTDKNYKYYKDEVNVLLDQQRLYNIKNEPVFEIFSKCTVSSCFNRQAENKKYIKNIIEELRNYTQNLDKQTIEFQIYNEFINKYDSTCNGCKTINEYIRSFFIAMKYIMEKYFVINKTIKYIGSYQFKFEHININHNIYNVKIISRITNNEYTLIYSNYDLKMGNSRFDREYYIILNIIPPNAMINKYGLYDKIMSAGVYVYNMFEHSNHCTIRTKDRMVKLLSIEGCYIFLGDYLENIWPLNEIKKIQFRRL